MYYIYIYTYYIYIYIYTPQDWCCLKIGYTPMNWRLP